MHNTCRIFNSSLIINVMSIAPLLVGITFMSFVVWLAEQEGMKGYIWLVGGCIIANELMQGVEQWVLRLKLECRSKSSKT